MTDKPSRKPGSSPRPTMSRPESAYRDNCPECLTGPYEPYDTEVHGPDLVGAYRCTGCGHVWPCWWRVASLPEDTSAAGDVA